MKYGRYPVPIDTQTFFLTSTRDLWLPTFFIWPVPGTHRYPKILPLYQTSWNFNWYKPVPGYRSCRPLVFRLFPLSWLFLMVAFTLGQKYGYLVDSELLNLFLSVLGQGIRLTTYVLKFSDIFNLLFIKFKIWKRESSSLMFKIFLY